jgi:hypothetical protein
MMSDLHRSSNEKATMWMRNLHQSPDEEATTQVTHRHRSPQEEAMMQVAHLHHRRMKSAAGRLPRCDALPVDQVSAPSSFFACDCCCASPSFTTS